MKVRHMWEGSPSEETIMKELTQENGEVFSRNLISYEREVFSRKTTESLFVTFQEISF